jgi:hypothetical protein
MASEGSPSKRARMDLSRCKIRSGAITGQRKADVAIAEDGDYLKRTGARAQLYAAGFVKADFDKPVVTVAAPYMSTIMCNQNFISLADEIARKSTGQDDIADWREDIAPAHICSLFSQCLEMILFSSCDGPGTLEHEQCKAFVSHPPVISDGQTMGSSGMR